jgi:TrpR family trp operon transcriptional repressor
MKEENTEDGWRSFLELCSKIRVPEEFNSFFALFLTFEERETMASRYLIIKALLEGRLTQREIADTYKVSIAQITRGSNALKIVDPEFKRKLEKKLSSGLS